VGSEKSLSLLLEKVAADTPWPVLVPLLSAVGRIPAKESLPVLIGRLKSENGRLRLDLNYALASITGAQHGKTADEWQTWWQANAPTFRVDRARTAQFREQHAVQDMQVPALGSFYNLDIVSSRVVFVVDTSMSMRGDKISSLKTHLGSTLSMLHSAVQFNVVDFGGLIGLMKPHGLVAPHEIRIALERVEQLTLSGGTRAYDAMELATALPGMDTMILLTDGAPVAGKFDAWPRLIAAVGILHRYWPVAIWCLEFSARGANHAAMTELSGRNWGRTRSSEP
jgi:uncharacterized protein YegL